LHEVSSEGRSRSPASTGIDGTGTKKIDPQSQDQFRSAPAAMPAGRRRVLHCPKVEDLDGQLEEFQLLSGIADKAFSGQA